MIRQILAENLKSFRKGLGLNQRQFAKPLGISGGYISKVEKGLSFLSESVLSLMEINYRINRNWLLYNEGDPYLKESALEDDTLFLDPKDNPVASHMQDLGVHCEVISKEKATARREAAIKAVDTFYEDVGYLREIYDYGDPGVINAIHCNLQSFAKTIHNDHGMKQRDKKIIEHGSLIDNRNTIETLIKKVDDIATGQKQIAKETKMMAQKLNDHLESPHKKGEAA